MKRYSYLLFLSGLKNAEAQYVGIGTSNPIATLDVNSTAGYTSKFNASDRTAGDEFGQAASIGANYFIIGAPIKSFSPFNNHGAAYIFSKN